MGFASSQSVAPVQLWEETTKPPWRPRVAGIAGFLCGPVAAALITFINLRRLERRRKAIWTLGATIVICVLFGVIVAKLSETTSNIFARLVGNVLSPLVYPLLQLREFEQWQASHPEIAHDEGWRGIGWAILGLVAFFAIALSSALAISWNDRPRDIEVFYILPETIKMDENFEFTIEVQNNADHPQLLHELDFENRFLEAISIQGV